jgi:hypothetical protein
VTLNPLAVRSTRLVLCVLSVTLSGCRWFSTPIADAGMTPSGPLTLTEQEPNNDAASALVVSGNAVVEGNLSADPTKPDEDWLVLTAPLPQTATLKLTSPPAADLSLEVVDSAKTVLARVNETGAGEAETLKALDVSGKVYLRVVGVKKGAGGAYRLAVEFDARKPGFEREPNERPVDATSAVLGQAISGHLAHGDDVDVFRYEFPAAIAAEVPTIETASDAGGESDAGTVAVSRVPFRIDLSPVAGVAFEVLVLTEADAVLFEARGKEGAALSLRNIGARQADRIVFISVKSIATSAQKGAKKDSNAETAYTLTVAPEDASQTLEIEPNNTADRAVELTSASLREGFISPEGDVDVYRVSTSGPSIASFEVSGVEGLDLSLSLLKEVEGKPDEVLMKANEGAVKEPERLNAVACDGSCLIRVETTLKKVDAKWVRVGENSTQAYRLSAKVVPDDGTTEREPNNKPTEGTPLQWSKGIRGTVFPARDVDFFRLDLSDKQVKTALQATVTGILKVDVGLYLHRLNTDGSLSLVQTADSAKGEKSETIRYSADPGVYVFEVRDAKNRAGNFQDSYQLTVEGSE